MAFDIIERLKTLYFTLRGNEGSLRILCAILIYGYYFIVWATFGGDCLLEYIYDVSYDDFIYLSYL